MGLNRKLNKQWCWIFNFITSSHIIIWVNVSFRQNERLRSHYFLCVHACVCVCSVRELRVCVWAGSRKGGVLREDTRGRVSARLCRLALTATDAGLKWESSWAACLPIQQENKSHVEEPLCGITDSRLTPQIHWGRPRAPARQHKPPSTLPLPLGLMLLRSLASSEILELQDCAGPTLVQFKLILGECLDQRFGKDLA